MRQFDLDIMQFRVMELLPQVVHDAPTAFTIVLSFGHSAICLSDPLRISGPMDKSTKGLKILI